MRRHSPGMSWRGPRPGPIASAVTGRLQSPDTNWPEWSPLSAMARRGCRLDSGCSASRTGIATARWRSMWPSRHATSHRCRATLTSRCQPDDVLFVAQEGQGVVESQDLFLVERGLAGEGKSVHHPLLRDFGQVEALL